MAIVDQDRPPTPVDTKQGTETTDPFETLQTDLGTLAWGQPDVVPQEVPFEDTVARRQKLFAETDSIGGDMQLPQPLVTLFHNLNRQRVEILVRDDAPMERRRRTGGQEIGPGQPLQTGQRGCARCFPNRC